jgi:fructosamine-3-kinase
LSLPRDVREQVEEALERHRLGRRIEAVRAVGGGCINNGARIETDLGRAFFIKWNRGAPSGMFEAEAEGLEALAAAQSLRVPTPIAWASDAETPWLLTEYVVPGSPSVEVLAALGRGLAQLHATTCEGRYGWNRDNWIGSLDQSNEPSESWATFWRSRRIEPQLALARHRGRARESVFDDLLDVIALALNDVDLPELLHGDLWGGNWFASADGVPVVIDPAVYRGHGEVDLAMSELFGGFGPSFYAAYDEVHGVSQAYEAYRRDLYQLYYLLVHVNLFGGAYEAGSLRAARNVLGQLR